MTRVSTKLNILLAGSCLICVAVIASLMSAGPVFAQDAGTSSSSVASRYSGRIGSVETAERALAELSKERSGIEQRFAADERVCHTEFFATSCIDNAKERRRHALAEVRKVEVEANAFLRQVRVSERDKALEDKRLERERKEAERLKREQASPPPDKTKAGGRENSGKTARETPPKPVQEPAPARPSSSPRNGDANQRQAQHDAKLKRLEQQERADAQKRADKVAAYERKVKEAEERQREVEAKKKEKELERAKRTPLN
jgi:colicin import membrane protein